jgi:hypothetical protein
MKYVNKSTGDVISVETYSQLSIEAKQKFTVDFGYQNNSEKTIINQQIERPVSLGEGIAVAAAIPFIFIASIFGD